MGRIMAIDVGQKRVGLAVTDPLRIIPTALETVHISEIFDYLGKYLVKEDVDLFLIGQPLQMNNRPSDSVKYVNPFINKLKVRFPGIPVKQVDERFTSKMAKQAMIEGGAKNKYRRDKSSVDKLSAVIILQSYLYGCNQD